MNCHEPFFGVVNIVGVDLGEPLVVGPAVDVDFMDHVGHAARANRCFLVIDEHVQTREPERATAGRRPAPVATHAIQ